MSPEGQIRDGGPGVSLLLVEAGAIFGQGRCRRSHLPTHHGSLLSTTAMLYCCAFALSVLREGRLVSRDSFPEFRRHYVASFAARRDYLRVRQRLCRPYREVGCRSSGSCMPSHAFSSHSTIDSGRDVQWDWLALPTVADRGTLSTSRSRAGAGAGGVGADWSAVHGGGRRRINPRCLSVRRMALSVDNPWGCRPQVFPIPISLPSSPSSSLAQQRIEERRRQWDERRAFPCKTDAEIPGAEDG